MLPSHLSLTINHNEHKCYYETVEEHLQNAPKGTWVSSESRDRAIQDNDMWSIQIYPETPVGFYIIYGRTLEEILNYLANISHE